MMMSKLDSCFCPALCFKLTVSLKSCFMNHLIVISNIHLLRFNVSLLGIITKSKVIMKHYLFSPYFVLDVAAVIPLEFFGLAWDVEERYGYIAVLRLNRLIKIWKVGE